MADDFYVPTRNHDTMTGPTMLDPMQETVSRDALIDKLYVKLGGGEAAVAAMVGVLDAVFMEPTPPAYVRARIETVYPRYRAQLQALLALPFVKQRSEAWLEARKTLITASDFAQALGKGKFGTQKQLIAKKCGYEAPPAFDGSAPPLRWGTLFEPVAQAIYSHKNHGVHVHEFGLLRDPSRDFFGASPDGITELGVMVEIKCPYQRAITGEIPEQYMYQIQGQLEVCGLDECDYIECDFDQYADAAHFWDEFERTPALKGAIVERFGGGEGETVTAYSRVGADAAELRAWLEAEASDACCGGVRITYWNLKRCNVVRVRRDPTFLSEKLGALKQVWGRIQAYQMDASLYQNEIGANVLQGGGGGGGGKRARGGRTLELGDLGAGAGTTTGADAGAGASEAADAGPPPVLPPGYAFLD
jgi:putative phage-type endonuclease